MEYESTCNRWRVVRRELLPGIQEKEVGMDLGSIADMRKFNPHLNQIYFEMNPKNKDEYRSVRIHINPFTNHPQAQRSNWIYGTPPENLKACLHSSTADQQDAHSDALLMLGEDSGEGKSRKRVKRKGKSDLIDRMLSSYRKRKRAKKLQKLLDRSDHWKGLE